MSINVSSYLSFLKVTVEKDIEKLKIIAKEGEDEYINNLPSPHIFGPDEIPTTILPPLTHFEHAFEQPSRCTIPLAMTCLSIVELLGNLIPTSYTGTFQNGAKQFFSYAGVIVSTEERELLRAIIRNGLMHKFFPNDCKIGITYDSSLEDRTELFVENNDRVILNVNYLSKIVLDVLKKVHSDTAIHQNIESNLQTVASQELQNFQTIIANFKSSKNLN